VRARMVRCRPSVWAVVFLPDASQAGYYIVIVLGDLCLPVIINFEGASFLDAEIVDCCLDSICVIKDL
jgi:hypothetical protein